MKLVLLYAGEKAESSQFFMMALKFDLAAIQSGYLDAH